MSERFAVGDLEVLVVSDGQARMSPTDYFPASTAAAWEAHRGLLDADGMLPFPFTCYVIRSGGKTVLIDTGLGPAHGDNFHGGDLLPELAAAGVSPAEIDVVFVTHLHVDHIGSAALREGDEMRVTFPNAVYRWTQAEQEFWSRTDLPPQQVARRDIFAAVAGRYEPADGGTALAPGVDVYALPGHTPGHAGVVLSSGGERAFMLGDGVSCPAQLTEAEWSGVGDVDGPLARAGQEALARELEGTPALVRGSHFPGLRFGRVLSGNGRRYWSPL